MTQLVDGSSNVTSWLTAETGGQSATFQLPATTGISVQSVVATIDNTAGADIQPTLTIRDDAGVVIATKRQGDLIPGGDTGTATWALRLTDESQRFAVSGWEEVADPITETLLASTTTTLQWSHFAGAQLLEYSTPQQPTFRRSGIYALTVAVRSQGPTPTTLSWTATLFSGNEHGLPSPCIASNVWGTNLNPINSFIHLARVWPAAAGDNASITVANPAGASRDFDFTGLVQRLA